MAINKSLFSSKSDRWETPDDLFRSLDDRYHFVLDAAADAHNRKCMDYFGPGSPLAEDALTTDWQPWLEKGNIWLNPPYSRKLQKAFMNKVISEMKLYWTAHKHDHGQYNVVCLLPARTDTKIFHEIVKPNARSVEFLKGRLKFKGAKHGAPFPSMIVVF